MKEQNTTPQIRNAKTAKKFFASSMKSIFHDDSPQCRYSSGDIVRVIRNVKCFSHNRTKTEKN